MKKFYRWLRDQRKIKDNHGTLLKGVRFSVFGLGDSSYEQYNAIGKFINEGLEELGAERVYKYGEGNAEGNHTEDDFNEWKAEMWKDLFTYY
jgi:NADPH-ferrihemoprotein reductase